MVWNTLTLKIKPVYIPENEVTMQLLIGSTGTEKGVLFGNFLVENNA